ncbi:MAG: ubiquinone/menaquinone biosynthesis methyltransferase [Anaerolineae bacterium]|nr:ubiquinone/menaquinone biosynthesis methyltransferase [Anaerolineae bacterium]
MSQVDHSPVEHPSTPQTGAVITDQQQKAAMRGMFSRIAAQYDTINRIISLGQDQRLRREIVRRAQLPPAGDLLDVASGTGDVALVAWQQYPEAHIVAVDLTWAMLRGAQAKSAEVTRAPWWSVGDGLALPFPAAAFDAVISAFMLRNVPDVRQAIVEQVRVLRPGGRAVCLEMSWPRWFPMSVLFGAYFNGWVPWIGRVISRDANAYIYLPLSVKHFLRPEQVAQHMESAGLCEIKVIKRMLGTAVIYVGEKPLSAD